MADDTKLPLTSGYATEELLARLREEAPHVFSEGKVDWDKLRATLGERIETRSERYGLTWAGKAEAFRAVQAPRVGTLLPMPDESVNFNTSENLIIEGDNLEVLKLLQKSYHGKVKMIYIDPPYNTGNEFIYPDNYREGLDDYLRYSGQVSDDGLKQTTNTETSGRFHSKWLSMMYPRLFLARNLLRDDGVIFVSIDDNEVHNLRMLMNEVFGEENFLAQITWKCRKYPDSRATTGISTDHEYVLIYGRISARLRGVERDESKFTNPDNDPRGPWMSRSILGLASKEQRPNLHYSITEPGTGRIYEPSADTGWRYSQERMGQLIASNSILFPTKPDGRPREKKFRSDMQSELIAFPSIISDTFTADGTAAIREIFGAELFDFSKPAELIKKLVAQGADDSAIVLDFFAGSGTTAQAVIEQNEDDSGNRKFILVQLPEKTDNAQYPTIADITRERVRRVIAKLNEADAGKLDLEGKAGQDRGFRAFKLSSSNFKIWNADQAATDPEQLAEQLHLYTDNLAESRTRQDILYELILKSGLPLTAKVEAQTVAGKTVHSIAEGTLLICLENPVTQELLRGMMAMEPLQILCLDTAFHGNDPLKTNAVLEAKSHGITFRTV